MGFIFKGTYKKLVHKLFNEESMYEHIGKIVSDKLDGKLAKFIENSKVNENRSFRQLNSILERELENNRYEHDSWRIYTPVALFAEILFHIPRLESKTVVILYNTEAIPVLHYLYNVPWENITLACVSNEQVDYCNTLFQGKIKTLLLPVTDIKDTEVLNDMKFDVVVGNPPYQDPLTPSRKLWVEFIFCANKVVRAGGICAMVTPNSWVTRPDGQKFSKVTELFTTQQLENVNLISPNTYFNIGEDIGYWILRKTLRSKDTAIFGNWHGTIKEEQIEFTGKKIIFSKDDELTSSIIDKIIKSNNKRMPWETELQSDKGIDQLLAEDIISLTKTSIFKFELFWTASQIYYTTIDTVKLGTRLVVNRSGYYFKEGLADKYMPIKNDVAVGIGGFGISFRSVHEAEAARELLAANVIRFFVDSQKTSGFNTALTKLPYFNLAMPAADLNKYFNLTQEEITYIDNYYNVK